MNDFMKEAIKEATIGITKKHGGPFGAVIVKNGKIISSAHNMVLKNNDPSAHAEISAIRAACKKLKRFHLEECVIYTSCEPCPMCLAAIHWARIKTIYYGCSRFDAAKIGFDDEQIYRELKDETKESFTKIELMKEECLEVFKKWDNENKIMY